MPSPEKKGWRRLRARLRFEKWGAMQTWPLWGPDKMYLDAQSTRKEGDVTMVTSGTTNLGSPIAMVTNYVRSSDIKNALFIVVQTGTTKAILSA